LLIVFSLCYRYVFGNYSYQSNYGAGLSILDLSTIPQKPNGSGVHEVGWFDVYREDDQSEGGGSLEFVGSWSSYAGFKSGYILINTIEQGAFLVSLTNFCSTFPPQ
jgi:hypothetical protein